MPTTADLLRRAAWRIRQGWCQDRMADTAGNVCALGAIHEVADQGRRFELHAELLRTIGFLHIDTWNDAPDQTQENVAQAFELAAITWEQESRGVPTP